MSQNVSTRHQIHNKYTFYYNLLEELLHYARQEDVKCWMAQINLVELTFLYDLYSRVERMPINARTVRRMQRMTDKMIRFYESIYPLRVQSETQDSSDLIIVKWNWQHLLQRAQTWQEMASRHDWSDTNFVIEPRYPQYEHWWNNTAPPPVGLLAEDNPYVIVSP